MVELRPFRTEAEYDAALNEVSRLVDLDPELYTPEADRLEVLGMLIEKWDAVHHKIKLPEPIEGIKAAMEMYGMTAKDLVPYIGNLNRVYEVLNRKRGLSIAMIKRLHKGLGLSLDLLIGPIDEDEESEEIPVSDMPLVNVAMDSSGFHAIEAKLSKVKEKITTMRVERTKSKAKDKA